VSDAVLRLSDSADRKLAELREGGRFDGSALRVSVREEGAVFRYQLEVVPEQESREGDRVVESGGVRLYVDPESALRLAGATLEYVDELDATGFRFDNPNRPALLENPIAAGVQRVLDAEVNPSLAHHGGQVSLVDVQGGRVFLRFGGGCQGCGMIDTTLREGIDGILRRAIPEISEVLDATDHAAGTNPYYSR
jgi:Fe/S biogenesis protein NfuA